MTAAGAEEECRSTQVIPTLQQSEVRLEASGAVLKAEEEKGKAGTKSASHDACVATHNEITDLRPYF